MLTKTTILAASMLLLGSVSAAQAEDPEANIYNLRTPAVTSQSGQVLQNSAFDEQVAAWRKRSNSH